MKKVLFVIYSLGFGGAERSLVNLLHELPKDRYEVDLLMFQRKNGFLQQVPAWVNILETPEAAAKLYGPLKKAGKYALPKGAGKLFSLLLRRTRKSQAAWRWKHVFTRLIPDLEKCYDVAVAYVGSEIQYYVADHVRADRKIVFIHNDYRTAGYSSKDDEPYFAKMDAIVSISKGCVDVLKEEFPQYAEKMMYLENITSSAVVRERAMESVPEEYEGDVHHILSVGRLWPQKGFDYAIDAAALLKKAGVPFRWYVVGEGSLRDELEKQLADNDLQEEFRLLGTRSNPYPYMQGCDVLVQSSRYEGKSVVLDEAKMLCKPIVATAYPTVADQVADGKEGIVVEMSAQGVAEGVMRMLQDKTLREGIVAYLSAHEYGNQAEVEKYMKLLDA